MLVLKLSDIQNVLYICQLLIFLHLKIDGNGQLKNKIKNAKNSLALIMSALLLPEIDILSNNILRN